VKKIVQIVISLANSDGLPSWEEEDAWVTGLTKGRAVVRGQGDSAILAIPTSKTT
jgi:hypothetical protein